MCNFAEPNMAHNQPACTMNNTETPATYQHIHLQHVDSTNNYLRTFSAGNESPITLVTADYQTAGRGQRGNSWESEEGKNLVFSLLVRPTAIKPSQMFALSEVIALSVCETLQSFTTKGEASLNEGESPSFCIKWPNDIYYGNQKIAGILIETDLMGGRIDKAIIGVGININQHEFFSDAPNPISLYHILGKESNRETILSHLMQRFASFYSDLQQGELAPLHTLYMQHLYRRQGFHKYQDETGIFEARIIDVEATGHYILEDAEGRQRRYAFKEVSFCL